MTKLVADFVVNLSKDPRLMEAFASDPDAVMAEHDLSDADREVLKSGDAERIRNHLGDAGPPGCLVLKMSTS